MSEEPALTSGPAGSRPGKDRMGWTVPASATIHLLVFAILTLPRLPLAEAPLPPSVNVDLVPASEAPSIQTSRPASEEPSTQAPSSQAPISRPSEAPASNPASRLAAAASEPPTASTDAAASSIAPPPPPEASASGPEPPRPMPAPRAGKVTIPVGPVDPSAQDSSVVSGQDGTSAPASDASAAAAGAPMTVAGGGKLHAAKRFYLKDMLSAPALSQARQALSQLPPERRLAQTCNIEASGQAGGAGYPVDAIIANAYAPPVASGLTYSVSGGVFRAADRWYRIAYRCTLNAEMSNVTAFSFHIGDDVTEEIAARLNSQKQQ